MFPTTSPLNYQVLQHAENLRYLNPKNNELELLDVAPVYDHDGSGDPEGRYDSGMRLYVLDDIELLPFIPTTIPHGIAVQPESPFLETQVRPRSSTWSGRHIIAVLGTVDNPYTGEIGSSVMYVPAPFNFRPEVRRTLENYYSAIALDPKRGPEAADQLRLNEKLEQAITPYELKRGERISQLVLAPVVKAIPTRVESLRATARGAAAWGTTGR